MSNNRTNSLSSREVYAMRQAQQAFAQFEASDREIQREITEARQKAEIKHQLKAREKAQISAKEADLKRRELLLAERERQLRKREADLVARKFSEDLADPVQMKPVSQPGKTVPVYVPAAESVIWGKPPAQKYSVFGTGQQDPVIVAPIMVAGKADNAWNDFRGQLGLIAQACHEEFKAYEVNSGQRVPSDKASVLWNSQSSKVRQNWMTLSIDQRKAKARRAYSAYLRTNPLRDEHGRKILLSDGQVMSILRRSLGPAY